MRLPGTLIRILDRLRDAVRERDTETVIAELLSYRAAVTELAELGAFHPTWDLEPEVFREAVALLGPEE